MSDTIYVARMKEFDKSKGNLRRNTIIAGRSYQAGNATKGQKFVPSNFVEITKEEAKELLIREHDGRWKYHQPGSPHNPVFDVFKLSGENDLLELIQKEADFRAAAGRTSARAVVTGRSIAQVITNKPRPALTDIGQLEEAPEQPVSDAKVETSDDLDKENDEEKGEGSDPLTAPPIPIEGQEKDPLDEDDDDQKPADQEPKKDEEPAKEKPAEPKSGKAPKMKPKSGKGGSKKPANTKKKPTSKNTGRSAKK